MHLIHKFLKLLCILKKALDFITRSITVASIYIWQPRSKVDILPPCTRYTRFHFIRTYIRALYYVRRAVYNIPRSGIWSNPRFNLHWWGSYWVWLIKISLGDWNRLNGICKWSYWKYILAMLWFSFRNNYCSSWIEIS